MEIYLSCIAKKSDPATGGKDRPASPMRQNGTLFLTIFLAFFDTLLEPSLVILTPLIFLNATSGIFIFKIVKVL